MTSLRVLRCDYMAVKSVSIRIKEKMLNKIGYMADDEGRSVNSRVK